MTVRDLYEMNFNPVLKGEDAIHIEEGKFVREAKAYLADVQVEQDLMLNHDVDLYIFPIWWNGMPAIMKGYLDRVFQHGFAYSFDDELQRRFAGKKALFFTPTGQPQNQDGPDTALTAAIKLLTSEWMFGSNGVEVLSHRMYGRVPYLSEEELEDYLQDVVQQLDLLD